MKQLNKGKPELPGIHHYNFDVMKPFLKFGIMAMSAIGHTLIAIVKNIPKPHDDAEGKPDKDKIIKI
jgi:hypothetical protein